MAMADDTTPALAPAGPNASNGRTGWGLLALVLFVALFFSTTLPNNAPTTRWFLLTETPGLLFDWTLGAGDDSPEERESNRTRGWDRLPQRLPLWGGAGLLLLTATALGRLVGRPLRIDRWEELNRFERWGVQAALGLSIWSLVTLGLGLAGWLDRWLFAGLMGGVIAVEGLVSVWTWRRHESIPSADGASDADAARSERWSLASLTTYRFSYGTPGTWLRVACLPFLVLILLGSALPSTDFDVNEYHFGGPKEYFQAGRISFLAHNVYTSFPFLTEMLTLSAMVVMDDWFWGAVTGKVLLGAYALMAALAVRAGARRLGGELAGDVAALVYLSTPWVFRISTIAYVEGALACYLALAWLLVTGPLCGSRVLLAGLFAGSAMACKYPGLVQVVLPVGVALVWRASARDRGRFVLLYGLGVAVTIGPWLLKNLMETGNPVYPLAYTLFGGRDWDAALNAKWRAAHGPNGFPLLGFLDGLFDVSVRNDWLSPLLYGGVLVTSVLGGALRRAARPTLLGLAWLYVAWWLLTHRLDRFWVPMLPLAALLAGPGLATLLASDSSFVRKVTWTIVVVSGACNFVLCGVGLAGYNDFLKDLPAARAYAARLTMPESVWLNANWPPGAAVLAVGDAELFEAQFPVYYNTVFDHSLLEQWCGVDGGDPRTKPLRPVKEIRETLAARAVSHVYVNWGELLRYRTTYGYTDFVSPDRLQELVTAGVLEPPVSPPEAFTRVASLADSWRAQVETWGKPLVRTEGGEAVLPLWSVYRVRP